MDNEKKYKELVGKIEKAYLYAQTDSTKAVLEEILPELKESEDERIRNWLEELIEAMPDNGIEFKDVRRIDVLHWIEKLGEKPQCKTMRDPRQVCRDRNMYACQAYKGAEAMAEDIRADVERILTKPSEKTVVAQLKEYFNIEL